MQSCLQVEYYTVMLTKTTYPLHFSLAHSLPHSLTDSLTTSLTDSLPHALAQSLPRSLTNYLSESLTDSPSHSLTHRVAHSLTASLTESLTDSLPHSPSNYFTHSIDLPGLSSSCLYHLISGTGKPVTLHKILASSPSTLLLILVMGCTVGAAASAYNCVQYLKSLLLTQ